MTNIKKHKSLLCLMAAVVLLSFFYMAPIMAKDAAARMQMAESACTKQTGIGIDMQGVAEKVISDAVVLYAAGSRPDTYPDSITAVRNALDEIATREQHVPRILIARFLAMMLVLILFVHVICGILMRRYGCHMIDLWENIYYIHLVDGKKDAPFLEGYIRR